MGLKIDWKVMWFLPLIILLVIILNSGETKSLYNGRHSALARLLKPRRASNPQLLERLVRRLSRKYEMYWYATERGAWTQYPGAPRSEKDWKRCRAWVVRKRFPSERQQLRSAGFTREVARIFRELFPLYAFSAIEGRAGEQALKRAGRR